MNSELLKVIEEEVAAERRRIQDLARQESEALLAEADAQAAALRQQAGDERTRLEAAADARARSAAGQETSALLLATKAELLDGLFRQASQQLQSLQPNQYQASLKALITEAAAGFAPGFIIRIRKSDVAAAQALVKEKGWQATVTADDTVADGTVVADATGALTVYNRFQDRLAKVRPALLADLARELWG